MGDTTDFTIFFELDKNSNSSNWNRFVADLRSIEKHLIEHNEEPRLVFHAKKIDIGYTQAELFAIWQATPNLKTSLTINGPLKRMGRLENSMRDECPFFTRLDLDNYCETFYLPTFYQQINLLVSQFMIWN